VTDRYTKIVFTIIAAALVAIAVEGVFPRNITNYTAPIFTVRIVP
jgi:hypothetical protein